MMPHKETYLDQLPRTQPRRVHGVLAVGVLLALFVALAPDVAAQVTPSTNKVRNEVNPAEPCCGITAIEARTGVVTATVTATGHTFRFTVKDRATLQSLRAGQQVWADFGTKMVRIYGAQPCCAIVSSSVPPQ